MDKDDLSSYKSITIDSTALTSSYNPHVWNSITSTSNLYNSSYLWSTSANTKIEPGTFAVTGDAVFDGNITWKGRNLGEVIETIEKRLSILVPDPEKLKHFEALQKAYENYKMLEALCHLPSKENE